MLLQESKVRCIMAGYFSHEIRTPLNTVVLGLQVVERILKQGAISADLMDLLRSLICQCDSAVDILDDLLMYANEGNTELSSHPMNISTLLAEAIRNVSREAEEKGVGIVSKHFDGADVVMCDGDDSKLAHVLRRLLLNAVQCTPVGDTVTVELDLLPRPDSPMSSAVPGGPRSALLIGVRVTDAGCGLAPEELEGVFRPDVAFDPGVLLDSHGRGIGLWLSRQIVTMHGGGLSVSSEGRDKGSTFSLTMPAYMHRSVSEVSVPMSTYSLPPTRDSMTASLVVSEKKNGMLSCKGKKEESTKEMLLVVMENNEDAPGGGGVGVESFDIRPSGKYEYVRSGKYESHCSGKYDSKLSGKGETSARTSGKQDAQVSGKYDGIPVMRSASGSLLSHSPFTLFFGGGRRDSQVSLPDANNHSTNHEMTSLDTSEELLVDPGYAVKGTGTGTSPRRTTSESFLFPRSAPSIHPFPLIENHAAPAPDSLPSVRSVESSTWQIPSPYRVADVACRRILVVDDAALNRKMLCRLLLGNCHVTVEAEDGAIAVEKLRCSIVDNEPFALVLMDYQMPVMDGPTAAKVMRGMGYSGPIIGVTGNALASHRKVFVANGADIVLNKPLLFTALKKALAELGCEDVLANVAARSS